jgi:hypothetical protein
LATLSIGAYFVAFTKDALFSYFDPDATTNLYRSWVDPAASLMKANLLFFLNSPFYRPMGSVWYRAIFAFAGFNPVPFVIVNLLILAANVWLTYCVSRRLAGSKEAAVLAAFLISFHSRFAQLYFDLGFVYDVLCYFFYFAALLFYIRIRSEQRALKTWEIAAFAVLYICTLNAKEIALTLPLFLVIYELLYQSLSLRSLYSLWRWSKTYGRPILLTGVLSIAFVIGRASGTESLLTNTAYQPVFSWERFMATSEGFLNSLFFQTDRLHASAVLLIWSILLAAAWASRSAALKFAWLFLMLSVLPIAFIPPRGAPQYYVPFFGWVLYAATALVQSSRWVFRRLPMHMAEHRAAAVFLVVGGVMWMLNSRSSWLDVPSVSLEGELFRSIVDQVHQLRPVLRRGSRVLFLDDPLDQKLGTYGMLFLMQLSYGDRHLRVDRAKSMPSAPDAAKIASYDYVFDYRLGRFYSSAQPRPHGPEPVVVTEWGRPALFHSNWTPVTRQHPARRGEAVISKAADLGDTEPLAPHDKAFPQSPLLNVASPVQVSVDGKPAEVLLKVGWPQMVNRYRVDFRIPKEVRPGAPAVAVTCCGTTGPSIPIPVE